MHNSVSEMNGPAIQSEGRSHVLQSSLQRLTQHKPRLRHRPLRRINHKRNPIHHTHNPLHLPSKIRMSRRIHNIDHITLIIHASALRQNRDPTLAFEVVRVHESRDEAIVDGGVGGHFGCGGGRSGGCVLDLFEGGETFDGAGLTEELVDEGGFAVIDCEMDVSARPNARFVEQLKE